MTHRFLLLTGIALGLSASGFALEPRPDIVLADFESDNYGDWTVEGRAFLGGPQEMPKIYRERHGQRIAISRLNVKGSDGLVGTLTSQPFEANHKYLFFLVGGGNYPENSCVNLLLDGNVVESWCGEESTELHPVFADLGKYQGKLLQIQIVDGQVEGVGHIAADYFVLTDRMEQPATPTTEDAKDRE